MTSKLILAIFPLILTIGTGAVAFAPRSQESGAETTVREQRTSPIPVPALRDDARFKMERDMAKKANEERHAALKRDTDKLLRLSTELKAYVDKSSQNTLSVDVIRKAEEIEKLAHSVKEKMKGN